MDWISLGGRGPPLSPPQIPPHPAIYEGPPPLKLPMDRISPHHGLCWCVPRRCVFFGLRVLVQKMLYFVISGPDFLKNVNIWSDFVICRKFGI